MAGVLDDREFRGRMERLETLLQEVERFPNPEARAHARELVQVILDLHGVGLERMLDQTAASRETGVALIEALARDDLVGNLLLLHGLHPLDLPTRVRLALDKVRPYLRSHGGNVELLGVGAGVVRLRMEGSCHGCPSSAMTLKLAIEEAIHGMAPDVTAIEVEGVTAPPPSGPPSTFVPVEQLRLINGPGDGPAVGGNWERVEDLASLAEGALRMREVSGRPLLFCRVGGASYAYADLCPGCGARLGGSRLEATALVCAGCGQRYDIARAGRGLDNPHLYLEPFPLLAENGQTKVALPL